MQINNLMFSTMAVSIGKGDKGDVWKRVIRDINQTNFYIQPNERLQLQFIGIVGNGVKSDSAIDDVRLHKTTCDRLCPVEQFTCDATTSTGIVQCIPWSNVCNSEKDCVNGRDELNCITGVSAQTTNMPGFDFTTGAQLFADWTTPNQNQLFTTAQGFNAGFFTSGINFDEQFTTPQENFQFTTNAPFPDFTTAEDPFADYNLGLQFTTEDSQFPLLGTTLPSFFEVTSPQLDFPDQTSPQFIDYDYLDPMMTSESTILEEDFDIFGIQTTPNPFNIQTTGNPYLCIYIFTNL